MPTTLLQIAQAVVNELGLPPLASLVGNNTPDARIILSLVNRSGDEIYQSHPWTCSQDYHIVEIETPITTVGDVHAGSDIIDNIPDTTGIEGVYFVVVGNGILQSTRVTEVIDGNSVRMDQFPTEDGTATELVFARDTYEMPDQFKWFANRTMWDRTNHWELVGPMSPQADQYERSGIVPSVPRKRWRQVGQLPTAWRLWPAPTASGTYPATLVFEYNSRYWASNAAGTRQATLSDDTDYPVIDAQAIVLAVKWRLWQQKGFEYGAMQAEANDYVSRLAARDGGSPDLSLAKRRDFYWLIGPQNIQDGSFPGPGNP